MMKIILSLPSFLVLAFSCIQAQAQDYVDCSEYQETLTFSSAPITVDYVITADEDSSANGGLFSAQVTYEGQGYIGLGFSPDGKMVGSLAVVGSETEDAGWDVAKYDMTSYFLPGVTRSAQQTLQDTTIEQNDTHTIMTFSKYLVEDGEITIDANGAENYILVAGGFSSDLANHQYKASTRVTLNVCQNGTLVSDSDGSSAGPAQELEFDDKESLFQWHGILAAVAWAFLAPLAIANAMLRHLIPKAGLWFQMHRNLNVLVLVLTIISFALVVKAFRDLDYDHFQSNPGAMNKHHTIGLVVTILVVVQSIGGILRPPVPKVVDGVMQKPTTVRVVWHFMHHLSGMTLLAMAWYQCYSGFKLYVTRFVGSTDYTTNFLVVAGTITGIGVLGKMHGIVTTPSKNKEANGGDSSNLKEENISDNESFDNPSSNKLQGNTEAAVDC